MMNMITALLLFLAPLHVEQEPVLDRPEGFEEVDRFEDISTACVELTKELAPAKWRRPILEQCEHRAYHSSRYKKHEAGTWIHDRDRPFAWRFYNWGRMYDWLRPTTCEHHKIDRTIRHSAKTKRLANKWPYVSPKMTEKLRGQWLSHPADTARFGTRGPIDNNSVVAQRYIPGCYPPESLDRYDVAATITILKSMKICKKHGCKNRKAIGKKWRNP